MADNSGRDPEKIPRSMDFLVTICLPRAMDDDDSKIPRLCTSYSILMNTRWNELCLVHKMNAVLLGVGSATAKVLPLHLMDSINIMCIHNIGR